ncbi:MAG: LLM class flavin-dependent oxidoreductase [Chloroflexi bacterium]|nr:LLM class flavin-dependent oxidoreductase [Chloroflexota bacterium]
MKFGVTIPGLFLYPVIAQPWEAALSGEEILRIARRAEELGFDWISVPDHIIMPNEEVEVMGPRWAEAFTSIAVIAGATKSIRVTNNILILPYRDPILLAKMVSTLDFLSGGRLIVSVAVGHTQREFDILGVPYDKRGAITDEYLRAMKELWTSDNPTFSGEHVQFHDVTFEPKPVQKPHPPIWIGGNARPVIRRAAALADGWAPWLMTPERLREGLDYLHEQPAFQNRTTPFEIVTDTLEMQVDEETHEQTGETTILTGKDEIIDRIGRYKDAGMTGTGAVIPPVDSLEQYLERMQWFREEVVTVFKA